MDACKVKPTMQQAVVSYLIDKFGEALTQLEGQYPGKVVFLRTAGTLSADEWSNELHPTVPGFNKMAKKNWVPAINAQFKA